MTQQQTLILAILVGTVALFFWGRWRHDMVGMASLLTAVLFGLVPVEEAFAGFGHPAVITVAAVLILSHGLQVTGAVDALTRRALPSEAGPTLAIGALTGLGALLSAFMNNVGAMALLMPIAVQMAAKHQLTPGKVLMPLAFGTILGGLPTLIGTPPNLIVSGFRAETGAQGFGMFAFTPVGLPVAGVGVLFVVLLGWRLVPKREQAAGAGFDTGTYFTEVRVRKDGRAAGSTLREIEAALEENDAQVVGLVRNGLRIPAPHPSRSLRGGDVLVIEAEPESLADALSGLGLELGRADAEDREDAAGPAGQPNDDSDEDAPDDQENYEGGEAELQEFVIVPGARLVGRSVSEVDLSSGYGLNLLAISRQGRRTIRRLRTTAAQAGDVLLLQGAPEGLSRFAAHFGLVPLAARPIRIPDKRRTAAALLAMGLAIGGAAFGLLPAAVSFAAGVLAFMALKVVPWRSVYEAVDWPVVVLLATLIPVAEAAGTTGAADLVANTLLTGVGRGNPAVAVLLILIITMTLSDFMNNAATAAVMAPVAISTALQLGANVDTFLMAVAVGASCAFLTPIGHQNNTLILGPGGFRFGDYWRLGLPTQLLVIAVSVPLLLLVWPI